MRGVGQERGGIGGEARRGLNGDEANIQRYGDGITFIAERRNSMRMVMSMVGLMTVLVVVIVRVMMRVHDAGLGENRAGRKSSGRPRPRLERHKQDAATALMGDAARHAAIALRRLRLQRRAVDPGAAPALAR